MARLHDPRNLLHWLSGDLLGTSGKRLVTIALVLLTVVMAVNFGELIARDAEIRQKIERQRETNMAHEAENRKLEARLAYFESAVHSELVAREQLGYAREGDTVILPSIAPLPTTQPVVESPQPELTPLPPPSWQLWWRAFFPST